MTESLLLNALKCKNLSRPPVWLMRQAGRYMPEYRAIRSRHDFMTMCHTPELAAEITLLPLTVFGMDAGILFSDILVILEGLGFHVKVEDGIGPVITPALNNPNEVDQIVLPNTAEAFGYIAEAIKLIKQQTKKPLLGFCGAPFTVASYAIEGKTSKDLKKTKQWLYKDPHSFHMLLDKIADCTIEYLKLQIKAGVDAVQIFDSWANALAFPQFEQYSLFYLKKIIQSLEEYQVPIIVFCRGASLFAEDLIKASPHCISFDWNCSLKRMRAQIPSHIAIQGNLDPCLLYASRNTIQEAVKGLLSEMQGHKGYIFNLGHGILPDTPTDSVRALVDCVKGFDYAGRDH